MGELLEEDAVQAPHGPSAQVRRSYPPGGAGEGDPPRCDKGPWRSIAADVCRHCSDCRCQRLGLQNSTCTAAIEVQITLLSRFCILRCRPDSPSHTSPPVCTGDGWAAPQRGEL